MVESGAKPCIGTVAGFTSGRKCQGFVIWRNCPLEVSRVARKAGSGEAGELARSLASVAVHAFQHRVSAKQWEAIFMILQLLCLDAPAFDRVAFLASRAELP